MPNNNELMFTVGINDATQQLDEIKNKLDGFVKEYSKGKEIQLQVKLNGLSEVAEQLSKIGSGKELVKLQNDIEAVNRVFLQLAKGAGGKGDLGTRAMAQEIERIQQEVKAATAEYNKLQAAFIKADNLRKGMRANTPKYEGAAANAKIAEEAMNKAKGEIDVLKGQLKILQSLSSETGQSVGRVGEQVSRGMRTAAMSGQEAVDAFKKMGASSQEASDKGSQAAKQESRELKQVQESAISAAEAIQKMVTASNAKKNLEAATGKRADLVEAQEYANKLLGEFGLTTKTITDQTKLQAAAEKAVSMEEQARIEQAQKELEIRRQIYNETMKAYEVQAKGGKTSNFGFANSVSEYFEGSKRGGGHIGGRSLMNTFNNLTNLIESEDKEELAEFKETMGVTAKQAMRTLLEHMRQVLVRAMRRGIDVSEFGEIEDFGDKKGVFGSLIQDAIRDVEEKIAKYQNKKYEQLENFARLLDTEAGASKQDRIAAAKSDLTSMATSGGKTYEQLISEQDAYIKKCNEEIEAGNKLVSQKETQTKKNTELGEAEKALSEKVQALIKAQEQAARFGMSFSGNSSKKNYNLLINSSDDAKAIFEKMQGAVTMGDRAIVHNSLTEYLQNIIKTAPNAQEVIQKLRDEIQKLGGGGVPRQVNVIDNALAQFKIPSLQKDAEAQWNKVAELRQKEAQATQQVGQSENQAAQSAKTLQEAIQQLGQKYKHTAEQAQKLQEIVSSGKLTTTNVQRGLHVGFNQATDIVGTINAAQKLNEVKAQGVAVDNASSSANKNNADSLKSEGGAADATKNQMEALVAAKKAVTEAEQRQSKANTENAETLKHEADTAKKTAQTMEQVSHGTKGPSFSAQSVIDGFKQMGQAGQQAGETSAKGAQQATNALTEEMQRLAQVESRLRELESLHVKYQQSREKATSLGNSYKDWLNQQNSELQTFMAASKIAQKNKDIITSGGMTLAQAFEGGKKNIIEFAQAFQKVDIFKFFGTESVKNLTTEINRVDAAYQKLQKDLASGVIPAGQLESSRAELKALEYRAQVLSDIRKRRAEMEKASSYVPRGYSVDEHLKLINEHKTLTEVVQKQTQAQQQQAQQNEKVATSTQQVGQAAQETVQKVVQSTEQMARGMKTPAMGAQEAIDAFKQMGQAGQQSGKDIAKSIERVKEGMGVMDTWIKEITAKIQGFKQSIEQVRSEMAAISSKYPNGMSKVNADPNYKIAATADREAQERAIAELDKKWEAYWLKQEKQANEFAKKLGKSLSAVDYDDFFKHINGNLGKLAKSWYIHSRSENYGEKSYLFAGDHESGLLKELEKLQEQRSKYGRKDFKYRNPEFDAELNILEQLKKKIDEYAIAKQKALDNHPKSYAFNDKFKADQMQYETKEGVISIINQKIKEQEKLLQEKQQKLNQYKEQLAKLLQQQAQQQEKVATTTQQTAQAEQQAAQGAKVEQTAIEKLTAAIKTLVEASATLKTALESIGKSGTSITGLASQFDGLIEKLKKANNEAFMLANQKNVGGTPVQAPTVTSNTTQGNLFDPKQFNELDEVIRRVIDSLNGLQKALQLNKSKEEMDALKKSMDEWNAKIKNLQDEYGQLQKKIAETSTKQGEGKQPTEALKKYNIEQLSLEIEKYKEQLGKLQEVYGQATLAGYKFGENDPFKAKIESLNKFVKDLEEAKSQVALFTKKTGWKDVLDSSGNLLFGPKNKADFGSKVLDQTKKDLEAILNGQMKVNEERAKMSMPPAGRPLFTDETGFMQQQINIGKQYESLLSRIKDLESSVSFGKSIGADTSRSEAALVKLKELASQMESMKSMQWSPVFDPKVNPAAFNSIENMMAGVMEKFRSAMPAIEGVYGGQNAVNLKRMQLNELSLREATVMYHQLTESIDKMKIASQGMKEDEQMKGAIATGEKYLAILKEIIAAKGNWDGIQPWNIRNKADYRIAFPDARDSVAKSKFDDKQINNQTKYNNMLVDTEKLLRRIDEAAKTGGSLKLDVSALVNARSTVDSFIERVSKFNDFGNPQAVKEIFDEYSRLLKVYGPLISEQERLNKSIASLDAKEQAKAVEALNRDQQRKQAEMAKAWEEQRKQDEKNAQNLSKQLERDAQARQKADEKARQEATRTADHKIKEEERAAAARQRAQDKLAREANRADERMMADRLKSDVNKKVNTQQVEEYTNLLAKAEERLNKLKAQMSAQKLDTSGIDAQIQKIRELFNVLANLDSTALRQSSKMLFRVPENVGDMSLHNQIKAALGSGSEEQGVFNALTKANKTVQGEIGKTRQMIDELNRSINRGSVAGRDTSGLEAKRSQLEAQILMMSHMSSADKLDNSKLEARVNALQQLRDETKKLKKEEDELTKAQERANKAAKTQSSRDLKAEEKSINDAIAKYAEFEAKLKELKALGERGINANIDISAVQHAIQLYSDLRNLMAKAANNGGRVDFNGEKVLTKDILAATKGNQITANASLKEYSNELNNAERKMRAASSTAENLSKHIDKLEASKVDFKGLDTSRLDAAIARIGEIRNELQRFATTGTSAYGSSANEIVRNMGLASANKEVKDSTRQLNETLKQNEKDKRAAAQATNQLTEAEQRMANAMKSSTNEAKGQSQVLSDLKMMATQYLSVWGVQGFLGNIIEIGGQLEKQRLSIGAILGDVSHANDLFGKIKGLAVKSPFGVVELDQFTKQLSAYGFKYNELYDMTKRLADIAAGAGTDVSRLTLAIGHVRSEGALTGYTLRQFAMNNIPMVGELAKKLSEVEKRVVTVADVRKRVSNKEIGYEDVIDVIKNLTNEGGMFYNMQEVISESIAARFKNLKDAMDIMYGEIAESGVGDVMKEFAVAMTNLSREWRTFIPLIESGAIAFAAYKTSMIAVNMTLGKQTASLVSNAIAYKQRRAAELQHEAMIRQLTAEELALVRTRDRITAANVRVAVSTGAMTKADALKLVALRKLSLEETKALIHMGAFTAAEARMARQGRVLGMNLGRLGASVKLFGQSLKTALGGAMSTIFSPWNMAFAGLAAGMGAYQRMEDNEEKRANRLQALKERANEGYKNMSIANKDFAVGGSRDMTDTDITLSLDTMMDKLREYSMLYNTTFNDAFAVDAQGYSIHTLSEQYEILAQAIDNTTKAQKAFNDMRSEVAHAIEISDPDNGFWSNLGETMYGWIRNAMFGEKVEADNGGLNESLEYYAKSVTSAHTAEVQFLKNRLDVVNALSSIGVSDAIEMDNEALLKYVHDLRDNTGDFQKFYSQLDNSGKNALNGLTSAWDNMNDAYVVAVGKMRKSGNDFMESAKVHWGDDMQKWPAEWQETVMMAMDAATKDVRGFSDMSIEYQNLVKDAFLRPFKISIDGSEASDVVNNILVQLNNLVGKKWVVQVGVKGEDLYKDKETAKKYYEDSEKRVKDREESLKNLGYKDGDQIPYWDHIAQGIQKDLTDTKLARDKSLQEYLALGGSMKDFEKKGRKGSGEDNEAKELREYVRIMKEAEQSYQYWRKFIGDKAAPVRVNDEFGEDLMRVGKFLGKDNFQFENMKVYKDTLTEIKERFEEIYNTTTKGGKKRPQLLAALKEVDKIFADITRKDFEKQTEDFLSKTTIELDSLTRAWSTFNDVRNATGNTKLAMQLGGVEYETSKRMNIADSMKEYLQRYIQESGASAISFNINKSNDEITDDIQKAFFEMQPNRDDEAYTKFSDKEAGDEAYREDLNAYQKRIKAIVEAYKQWRDLQRDVVKQNIQNFANLIKAGASYEEKLNKIDTDLQTTIANNNSLVGHKDENGVEITPEQAYRANRIAEVTAEDEKWKLSSQYNNLMNNSLALTGEELESGISHAVEILNKKLEAGTISAKEYAEEMRKLRELQNGWSKENPFGNTQFTAFAKGGLEGLKGHMEDEYYKLGSKEKLTFEESVRFENLGNMLEKIDKVSEAFNGLGIITQGVTSVLGSFQKTAEGLSNMFAALGKDSAANDWSDIADVLGGITSAISPINNIAQNAMSGNIAGIVTSAITSPIDMITGPITAFAKLSDKQHERNIQALKANVAALEANTKMLQDTRSRQLGYDMGDYRSSLSRMYSGNDKKRDVYEARIGKNNGQKNSGSVLNSTALGIEYVKVGEEGYKSAAQQAMYEYYSSGSGYEREYSNLKKQREDYMNMYNEEESKKDSSNEALEEYKQKIAELDDKIVNFSEDLAKNLWSIDIKGWASQIGDALMTAFENGENAANAFNDAVKNIMQTVVSQMIKVGIIEPMMQKLHDKLFGFTDEEGNLHNGVFDMDNPQDSMEAVAGVLGDFFGKDGEGTKMIDSAKVLYESMNDMLKQKGAGGLSGLDNDDSDSSSLGNSIQSAATEESIGILTGYIAALRQDVSVKRVILTTFVNETWQDFSSRFDAQRQILDSTFTSVRAIEKMMNDGSGAMYDAIYRISKKVDSFTTPDGKVKIS